MPLAFGLSIRLWKPSRSLLLSSSGRYKFDLTRPHVVSRTKKNTTVPRSIALVLSAQVLYEKRVAKPKKGMGNRRNGIPFITPQFMELYDCIYLLGNEKLVDGWVCKCIWNSIEL